MVLVKWSGNWADEMDLEGHFVLTSDAWMDFANELNNYTGEISYCVGSNEDIEYCCGSDALSSFSIRDITDQEYEMLKKLKMTESGFTGPELPDEMLD